MKMKAKILISIGVGFIIIILGVGIGSIFVPPKDIISIIYNQMVPSKRLDTIPALYTSIVWYMRLPRVLVAFVVGGALAVSGTVLQSVLKNPLASSYTLGVSSGASLGAAIVIITGFTFPILASFTLPIMGLVFGLFTVYFSIHFSARMDKNLENNTIILVGMVFSLFINGCLTLMIALNKDNVSRLTFWQMGSFSSQNWTNLWILLPIVLLGMIVLMKYSRELDILTFGEEQALTMGVDTYRIKWLLLGVSAILTGSAISFVGVIGFIDLIAPHVVRRIFGTSHRITIPMSFIFGGYFMVLCDLAARTLTSPSELPVGAITALIGAPFFANIYFSRRKGK